MFRAKCKLIHFSWTDMLCFVGKTVLLSGKLVINLHSRKQMILRDANMSGHIRIFVRILLRLLQKVYLYNKILKHSMSDFKDPRSTFFLSKSQPWRLEREEGVKTQMDFWNYLFNTIMIFTKYLSFHLIWWNCKISVQFIKWQLEALYALVDPGGAFGRLPLRVLILSF